MRFEFATATRIIFGPGALQQAGPIAREFGSRALVTTGRDPSRAKPLLDQLSQAGMPSTVLAVEGEPDIPIVQKGLSLAAREKCDVVISFGGGSALDAGKAIAVMMTNGGDLLDYLEIVGKGKSLTKPSAPFVAIPTTAGTGSEVTRNAVLALPDRAGKVSLRSPFMLPKVALVDPELTLGLPPGVTARTGLDALTQLIEPFVSPRANPMTDGLCVDGIKRAAKSLRPAFHNGRDASAREDMAIASLFGGLALSNAGLGAVHGFAGVLGGKFGAPHGAICGILLPQVMAANMAALRGRAPSSAALNRYEEVARLLTGKHNATANDGVDWVGQLVSELKIPPLSTYGVTEPDLPEIVEKSKNASSMKANPIVLTDAELTGALKKAI